MTSSPSRTRRTLAALRTHINQPPLALLPLLAIAFFTLPAALASRALLHTLSSALFLASPYPAAPYAPPPQAAPVTTSDVAIGARETRLIALPLPLSRPAQDLIASYIDPASSLLLVLPEPVGAPAINSSLTLARPTAACEEQASTRPVSHPLLCTSDIPPDVQPFDRAVVLSPTSPSKLLFHLTPNALLFLSPLSPPRGREVARVLGDSGIVVYSPFDGPSGDASGGLSGRLLDGAGGGAGRGGIARLLSTIEGAYDKEARARAVARTRSRERLVLDALALALAAGVMTAARAGWTRAARRFRTDKRVLG